MDTNTPFNVLSCNLAHYKKINYKKILLSLTFIASAFASQAQVVVAGVSPASVQGNYDYGNQTHEFWPGEAGDGSWDLQFDFNIAGNFIQDTLVFVEDGTPGLNPQGNPLSQEGCFGPLTNSIADGNDLTGHIAVIYRNTCDFGYKALQAQNAGAIAVILLNREDALIGLLGGTDGPSVTIPVVVISNINGDILTSAMANGPVEVLIGNKQGAFPNDVGAVKGEFLVSPFGGANNLIYDGFTPGIQVYNFGSADQTDVMINASIDGPSGNVYDETINPLAILSGDTVSAFPGNTDEFIAWQLGIGNYTDGNYTLTYTVSIDGLSDDSNFDNVYTSDFKIQSNQISLSRLDVGDMPIATNYPNNSTTEYQSCITFQDANASALAVEGVYFVPHTDTSLNELAGAEIFVNAYQWDDAWVDLDDPAYQFDPATNDAFQNLNLITFGTHYPSSNDDVDDVAFAAFDTPFQFNDNTRYLFCLQTFESVTISFGYDGNLDYDGNEGIIRQPVAPVHVDGQWYAAGWAGSSASSIALKTFDPATIGLGEVDIVDGSAFPNPATDKVTISIDANGDASLQVINIAGKVAMNSTITLESGSADVDLSSLESGVYIFNVTLVNGQTSQFNVVKN